MTDVTPTVKVVHDTNTALTDTVSHKKHTTHLEKFRIISVLFVGDTKTNARILTKTRKPFFSVWITAILPEEFVDCYVITATS